MHHNVPRLAEIDCEHAGLEGPVPTIGSSGARHGVEGRQRQIPERPRTPRHSCWHNGGFHWEIDLVRDKPGAIARDCVVGCTKDKRGREVSQPSETPPRSSPPRTIKRTKELGRRESVGLGGRRVPAVGDARVSSTKRLFAEPTNGSFGRAIHRCRLAVLEAIPKRGPALPGGPSRAAVIICRVLTSTGRVMGAPTTRQDGRDARVCHGARTADGCRGGCCRCCRHS